MMTVTKIRRFGFSLRLLIWFCILSFLPTTAVLAQDDVRQAVQAMESLAEQGQKLVQQGGNSKKSFMDAAHRFESAIKIYDNVPNKEDDELQSSALFVFSQISAIYLTLATKHLVDPSKSQALSRAEYCATQGLNLAVNNGFGPDAQLHFHELIGKINSVQQRDCKAAYHLEKVYDIAGHRLSNLQTVESRFLTASSIGSCYPQRGIKLWYEMLESGYIDVKTADSCPTCWAFILVAHERTKAGTANTTFHDRLQLPKHTPYKHAMQVPQMINTALLTDEPQPYQDPKQSVVCQALEANKKEIINEYNAYQQAVKHGKLANLHEQNHPDITLSEESGGGWDGLFLRRGEGLEPDDSGNTRSEGWQDHTCAEHFPTTCSVLRSIPEVNGKLQGKNGGPKNCANHNNSGYSKWCRGNEGKTAGVVAFYSLQPGSALRLHTGPTNQRLKCHLVISAPSDGSAWMEVGGIKKTQSTGDVIAFDDSYFHRVGNDHLTEVRVILDVTHYHPDLTTDEHVVDRQNNGNVGADPNLYEL